MFPDVNIKCVNYIFFVTVEVRDWYLTLSRMIQTIDQWGKVQQQWLYLVPFFSTPDIICELQEEGVLFDVSSSQNL